MNYSVYQELFIAIATGVLFVYGKLKTRNQRSEKYFNIACVIAFAVYMVLLLWLSVFGRESGVHDEIVVRPFVSIKTILTVYATFDLYKQIIDNVLIFIPFGFLLPQILKCDKNKNYYWITAVSGLVLSGVIEMLQHLLSRGVCDFDDILNNTLGAIVGCGFYCFVKFAKIDNGTLVLRKNWAISFLPIMMYSLIIFIITFYRENILLTITNR